MRPLLVAQGIAVPASIAFPLTEPADEDQRIQQSLDDTLTTPYNHSINVSYGRDFGRGLSIEASYVGRFARNLLASRDIMQLNNIRDPQSNTTWYQAANQLVDSRYAGARSSRCSRFRSSRISSRVSPAPTPICLRARLIR